MRHREAAFIYVVLSGASALLYRMIFVVEVFYQIKAVGLNPFQLVLVGTVGQVVAFAGQAPTGILADMYSRRWAVVGGLFLVGGGYLVEGLVPQFGAVLAGQAVSVFGGTLVGGADAAWIADEVGAERVGHVYLRGAQAGSLAGLVGVAASTALGTVRLNLPIVVAGSLFLVLSSLLALVMPERHFTPAFTPAQRAERTTWQQMGYTLRASLTVVRRSAVLLTILSIGAFYSIFGAGFDRLWPYHLQHDLTFPTVDLTFPTVGGWPTVIWFGLIEAGITLTNVLGTEVAKRRVETTSHQAVAWALCAIDGLSILCVFTFAVAGQFALALGVFLLFTAAAGPRGSLEQVWMNQNLEPSVRATVFSLRGQVSALAGIAGGPILGAIALAHTTRAALMVTALVLVPTLLLYLRAVRRSAPLVAATGSDVLPPMSDS